MREAVRPVYVKVTSPVPCGPDVTCEQGMEGRMGMYYVCIGICNNLALEYYKLYNLVTSYL